MSASFYASSPLPSQTCGNYPSRVSTTAPATSPVSSPAAIPSNHLLALAVSFPLSCCPRSAKHWAGSPHNCSSNSDLDVGLPLTLPCEACTRYRPYPGPPGAPYNSSDLLENLAGCRNTLKFLRIAVPGYGLWKSADSLKEFRVLEYLSLSMDFVEGDDPEGEDGFFALPPSLKVLQLHSICWGYALDEYGVEELIEDFTLLPLMRWLIEIARAASGGLLPELACVRCQRPGEIRDEEEIERAKLELDAAFEDYAANLFADTGVEFELRVY